MSEDVDNTQAAGPSTQAAGPFTLQPTETSPSPLMVPTTEQPAVHGDQTPPSSLAPAKTPKAKRGKPLHISDANLRRSERVNKLNGGFKSPCRDRQCLGFSFDPPLLSSSVVRELGSTFCKLDAASLSDEKLNAKPTEKGPVGKPKAKSMAKPKKEEPKLNEKETKTAQDDPEDGTKAKKSKK